MRLPLRVEDRVTKIAIVDADGTEIASAQALPWAEYSVVKENLTFLVEAANATLRERLDLISVVRGP